MRRVVLILAALCVVTCGGSSSSPTEPSGCVNIAGTYNGGFHNSCGVSGSGTVVVAQSGCNFSALIPGPGGGTVSGTISGQTATFTLTFGSPCSGSATGSATLSGTAINGTYSGAALGSGCCNPVSGSFTLTR